MSVSALIRPTFADLRAEIERRFAQAASANEIDTLVEQFLAAGGDTPVPWVEYDGTVTWIYRDPDARSVSVIGDIIGCEPEKTRMARLSGSGIFALTAQIPLDARAEYAFLVDHDEFGDRDCDWRAQVRNDPLNPKQIVEVAPMRALSVLEMPNARPVPELDYADGDPLHSVVYQVVSSADRASWARVWVALPPGYDPRERRYPTLYLNDGESYLLSARAAQVMEALVEQGEVAPMILVFVQRADAGARWAEERLDTRFAHFLADELVPWIDARYATSNDPRERAIGGTGVNATLSLYVAIERPEVFRHVIAQSPIARSFSKAVPVLLERNAIRSFGPPQCYIDVGRYEPQSRIEGVHTLCSTLLNNGAAVSYQEFGGDHSFLGWRSTLPDALRCLFGAPPIRYEL